MPEFLYVRLARWSGGCAWKLGSRLLSSGWKASSAMGHLGKCLRCIVNRWRAGVWLHPRGVGGIRVWVVLPGPGRSVHRRMRPARSGARTGSRAPEKAEGLRCRAFWRGLASTCGGTCSRRRRAPGSCGAQADEEKSCPRHCGGRWRTSRRAHPERRGRRRERGRHRARDAAGGWDLGRQSRERPGGGGMDGSVGDRHLVQQQQGGGIRDFAGRRVGAARSADCGLPAMRQHL